MKKPKILPRLLALFMPLVISANMLMPAQAAGVSDNALVFEETPSAVAIDSLEIAQDEGSTVRNESSGIKLTAAMQAAKAELAEIDLAGQLTGLAADSDYVDHEVVYEAASKAEAEKIAKAYQGRLTSYAEGIAVAKVPESTLAVIERAQDTANDFPAVYPNYIYRVTTDSYSAEEIEAAKQELAEGEDPAVDDETTPTEDETDPVGGDVHIAPPPDETDPAEDETDPAVDDETTPAESEDDPVGEGLAPPAVEDDTTLTESEEYPPVEDDTDTPADNEDEPPPTENETDPALIPRVDDVATLFEGQQITAEDLA
ncbi:MAG: hypothetical protein LBI54_08150, partial [Lachnospiraceae bacterium]|nr:hypothetical protein [Lachnospiraceae bacterium]